MKGAGSAYARPSRRRKSLPPRSGSRARFSAGIRSRDQNPFAGERRRSRLRFEPRQQFKPQLVHRIEAARQYRLEQLFLAAEMIVHRSEVHLGRRSDRAQAGRLEAVLHEQRLARVEDAQLGCRGIARRLQVGDSVSHGGSRARSRGSSGGGSGGHRRRGNAAIEHLFQSYVRSAFVSMLPSMTDRCLRGAGITGLCDEMEDARPQARDFGVLSVLTSCGCD